MKRFIIDWLSDNMGPRRFYSNKERLRVDVCPLNKFKQFKTDIENTFSDVPGIYILMGNDEQGVKAYIGESDNLNGRVTEHTMGKKHDYTDTIALIHSYTDSNLSKDEMHFLEKELIKVFEGSSFNVQNGNRGQGKKISGTDKMILLEDLEFILTGLNSLSIDINNNFIVEAVNESMQPTYGSDRGDVSVYCEVKNSGVRIQGTLHPNNTITIFKNQMIVTTSASSGESRKENISAMNFFEKQEGVVIEGDIDSYKITLNKDVTFRSPSGAATTLKGGANNGWKSWIDVKTNKEIDIYRK